METINIRYLFRLPDKRQEIIALHLDAQTLDLINAFPEEMPYWTDLDFHQCPNCPLNAEDNPYCLVAAHFVKLLETFESLLSHYTIQVDIITGQRVGNSVASMTSG